VRSCGRRGGKEGRRAEGCSSAAPPFRPPTRATHLLESRQALRDTRGCKRRCRRQGGSARESQRGPLSHTTLPAAAAAPSRRARAARDGGEHPGQRARGAHVQAELLLLVLDGVKEDVEALAPARSAWPTTRVDRMYDSSALEISWGMTSKSAVARVGEGRRGGTRLTTGVHLQDAPFNKKCSSPYESVEFATCASIDIIDVVLLFCFVAEKRVE